MKRFACLAVAFALAATTNAHAASATARASATIFKPMTITASAQMSFGKLQYNAGSGPAMTTVVLSAQAPITRTSPDAQLLSGGGETPAIRNVTGQANAVYRVTISNTTSTPGGLLVDAFKIWSTNGGDISSSHLGMLNGAGTDTIRIGATLHVPVKTKNDVYTAMPTILISYE